MSLSGQHAIKHYYESEFAEDDVYNYKRKLVSVTYKIAKNRQMFSITLKTNSELYRKEMLSLFKGFSFIPISYSE